VTKVQIKRAVQKLME